MLFRRGYFKIRIRLFYKFEFSFYAVWSVPSFSVAVWRTVSCVQLMRDDRSSSLTLFLVDQDDVGGQQRSQTINIPVEAEKSSTDGDSVGSAMVDQLRNSLQSLDEMRTRFVEERNQWNAERDQLKATATEVCLFIKTSSIFFFFLVVLTAILFQFSSILTIFSGSIYSEPYSVRASKLSCNKPIFKYFVMKMVLPLYRSLRYLLGFGWI